MSTPCGYSIVSYGQMITCEPRMSAYAAALKQAVTPGCKVIDLGAGPGAFSLLACQYGAASVVAIEPDDSVLLLKETARDNGFDDRIEIFHGLSSDYSSDRLADVIISDLRGSLPLFEGHIPTIIDARERLLAPGGRLIPARDTLHVALVDHPSIYDQFEDPWLANSYDIDLSAGHRFAVNRYDKVGLDSGQLLSSSSPLLTLDYATITNPSVAATVELGASRDGIAHGFVIWFDAELGQTTGFSNAPGEPEQVYGQCFFPFERPIRLGTGDTVTIAFRGDYVGGSYIWSWNSEAKRAGDKTVLLYRQSTFRGKIMSPASVAARSSSFVPPSSIDHEIDCRCLSLFNGVNSVGDIALQLADEFPHRFTDYAGAFGHVSGLAARYKNSFDDRERNDRS